MLEQASISQEEDIQLIRVICWTRSFDTRKIQLCVYTNTWDDSAKLVLIKIGERGHKRSENGAGMLGS